MEMEMEMNSSPRQFGKSWFSYFVFYLSVYCFLAGTPRILYAQKEKSAQKIKLLFVGDIMGHSPQIEAAEIIKNKQYDYAPAFEFVNPLIKKADLAIGNLELTLPGIPPYQGWPNFKSPNDLGEALKNAGFDLLTTANNHSNDAGKNGVINTITTLQKQGFLQTGTYQNISDRDLNHPLIIHKKGFRLAFLNYTYGTDLKKDWPPTIVNKINPRAIQRDILTAKKKKPDAIIVLLHWGKEYKLQPHREQKKLAKQIITWGADIIIGAHPHVVQPIEKYQYPQPNGIIKTSLVAYSLGNFISNQRKRYTDGGIILEVELRKDQDNYVTIGNCQYLPVWRHIQTANKKKKTFRTIPISAFEKNPFAIPGFSKKDHKAMLRYGRHIRKQLGRYDVSEKKLKLKKEKMKTVKTENSDKG